MTVLSALRFEVGPENAINARERETFLCLHPTGRATGGVPVVRVALEPRGVALDAPKEQARPARVTWDGQRLLLSHAAFEAVIDASAGTAVVRRAPNDAAGLVTTLRTALSARLPLEGGMLVHAAALACRGRGFVFFGPSGIGKSTLAERSPWRVLSDELVAVLPRRGSGPPHVSSATFPGPLPVGRESASDPRLACFIELAQAPRFHLERLERGTALRRLLGSIVVPPGPPLWSAALKVAGDLVRDTPCYRMEWSLAESPFEPLEAALDEEVSSGRSPRAPG